jgi:hypothetical protein
MQRGQALKKPFYRLNLNSTRSGGRDVYRDFKRKKDCKAAGERWVMKLIEREGRSGSGGWRCKKITSDMWWVK